MTAWIGCSFPDCPREHRARGYCNAHLEQQRRGRPLTPLRILPRYAWTYVVYWPDHFGPGIGVLKVGRAWSRSRMHGMIQTGAQILHYEQGTDSSWERVALAALPEMFHRAFEEATEADDILWRGRGWTECFTVPAEELRDAVELCLYAFSIANPTGENPPSAYRRTRPPTRQAAHHVTQPESQPHAQWAPAASADDHPDRSDVPRIPDRPGRSEADSPRPVADGRSFRRGEARPCPPRRGAVSRRRPGVRAGSHRVACTDARGVRLPLDVGGSGRRVARAAASARPGNPRNDAGRFHSFKESARAGARAGASASARGARAERAGVGGVADGWQGCPGASLAPRCAGCSADGVPGSSQRLVPALWSLRHRCGVPQEVPRRAEVRGSTGGVGVLARHRRGDSAR